MKKVVLIVLSFVLMLALAVTVFAASPVHQVSGGGQLYIDFLDGYETYGFNAQIDAEGNVKGQMQGDWRDSEGVIIHLDITCLAVDGTTASLGGIITKTTDPNTYPVGEKTRFQVRDNGEGGAAPPDQIGYFFMGNDDCNSQFNSLPLFDLVNGDIQVD